MPQLRVSEPHLYGRRHERDALDQVLERTRGGEGSTLLLVGEPGIGKTTLLRYAMARAADFRVLSCRGVPSETELAFAGLHELLWPSIDRIDGLPPAQAAVLRGALRLGEHSGDRLLIGVAVLTLLSELAERQPVLVVVDDLQFLDEPTRHCLRFVARRIAEEPIAMLGATQPGALGGAAEQLPHLTITGLDNRSAEQLVAQYNPRLNPARTGRLIRLTGGNPLALSEWSQGPGLDLGLTAEEQPAIGPRLRAGFGARLRTLPDAERTSLLIVAAADGADAAVVRAAVALLEINEADWLAALRSGLIGVDHGRITVRHPLIRAVVYETADPERRRAVHAALARAYTDTDPDRRAWHLAGTAAEPDEAIATALDAAAERAWARGGALTAARLFRRAAALSPDSAAAARRLARAARTAWDGGDVESARELLATVGDRADPAAVGAAGGGLEGLFELGQGDPERARRLLLRDAETAEPRFRGELQLQALRANWVLGEQITEPMLAEIAARDAESAAALPPWRLPIADVAISVGTEDHALRLYRDGIERMRTDGPISWLGFALCQQAVLHVEVGRWDEAVTDAAESLRLAEDFGGLQTPAFAHGALGFLAAVRGDEPTALAMSERILSFALPRRFRPLTAKASWIRGLAALSAGRPDAAFEHLDAITTPGGPAHHPVFAALVAADAAEAAVRVGRPDRAHAHLELLTAHTELTSVAWSTGDAHRVRALLASGPEAESSFAAALATFPPQRSFSYARIQLLFGEWLRRARRRREALELLRSAHTTFERQGAVPWAERAEREIVMAGDRATVPTATADAPLTVLTAQQVQVARLAAAGLTNREIAARLLISPRTVGNHLSQIFRKLGLAGREDLAKVDFERGFRLTS